nr:MAG TPA: hypothetical protein [Caudoviricetes sp.]
MFEKLLYWEISRYAPNRGNFNDYSPQRRSTLQVKWKWDTSLMQKR